MARKIAVEIVGDASSLERSFKQATRSTRKFNRDITSVGRATEKNTGSFKTFSRSVLGGNAALIGAAGLAAGVKASFDEMADSQKVAAQTAAVLKSTGAAANVTAKHVDELASSLLKKSGVDDEVIASGENMLLTFTKIRNEVGKGNDVFDQATRATLDLSVALGKDMQSSAVLVGKALNDPVKGLTALTRAGVSFDEGQKKQIKSLVATGRTVEAQKIILAELNREFGKSAEAAGKTLPGQLSILRESLTNTGGSVAEDLAPSLQLALGLTNKLAVAAGTVEGKSVKGRLGHFGFLLGSPPIEATKMFAKSVTGLGEAFGLLKKNTPEAPKAGFFSWMKTAFAAPAADPAAALPDRGKRTADQLNTFFDDRIGRMLSRLQDAPLKAQLAKLKAVGGLLTKRLAATNDITRQLTLEDQLLEVAGQQKAVRAQLAQEFLDGLQFNVDKAGLTATVTDDVAALNTLLAGIRKRMGIEGQTLALRQQELSVQQKLAAIQSQQAAVLKAAREQQAQAAKAAAEQATRNRMDWLQFALEKAEATKTLADDVKALKRIIAFIKEQIRLTGRTVELARQLWQTEQRLADVNKRRKKPRRRSTGPQITTGWDFEPGVGMVRTGLFGARPGMRAPPPAPSQVPASGFAINTVNVYGVTNVKEFEAEMHKRTQARPQTRRGPV